MHSRKSYQCDLAGDEGINRSVRFPSFEEVDSKLRSGEWQIHKFPKGFILTEIKQYPDERVLLVHVIRGEDLDNWKSEAMKSLSRFGEEHGCKAIEAQVRLGLIKKLKPLGFKTTRAEVRAEICQRYSGAEEQ